MKNKNSLVPPLSLSSSFVAPPSMPPLGLDLHTFHCCWHQRRVQADCTSKSSHPFRLLPQFVFSSVFFPASARLHLRVTGQIWSLHLPTFTMALDLVASASCCHCGSRSGLQLCLPLFVFRFAFLCSFVCLQLHLPLFVFLDARMCSAMNG